MDSTYRDRDSNKTDMSEFNTNNSNAGIKMHKRYESHQNINTLIKKNNDYYTNPKSNVIKKFLKTNKNGRYKSNSRRVGKLNCKRSK